MKGYRLGPAANRRLDEIYAYTAEVWGDQQARRYLGDLFDAFARIAAGDVVGRPTSRRSRLSGYSFRSGSHIIYWRNDRDVGVEIMSILHMRMNQAARLADDLT